MDFDAATRDPANPSRLLPAYDSGHHLHPSDAGYAAMANTVDLTLFSSQSAGRLPSTYGPSVGASILAPVAAALLLASGAHVFVVQRREVSPEG